jgi:hypothetical protein
MIVHMSVTQGARGWDHCARGFPPENRFGSDALDVGLEQAGDTIAQHIADLVLDSSTEFR